MMFVWRHGYWITLGLAVASICATWTCLGDGAHDAEYGGVGTRLYQSFKTLFLNSPTVDSKQSNNELLELGRWLGVIVFSSGIIGVASRLFSQSALTLFTWLFSHKQVILAGLGPPEEKNEGQKGLT